jgi:uncharacterized membrane protein YfcA
MGVLCGVGLTAAVAVSVWLLRSEAKWGRGASAAGTAAASQELPQTAADAEQSSSDAAQHKAGSSVVQWTGGVLVSIHVQMVIAGLMLGAWPLSPIILAIPGMHPQVGAGTSKLMLFMITAGAGLSFIVSGNINMTYMLVYGLINAVATPIGVALVDWAIKRTGRPSCIIMLTIVRLMACVVLQAALQAAPSLVALAHGLPRAGFLAQPFCQQP